MRIALAQIRVAADIEDNISKAEDRMREAAEQNASLIIFPELQLSPFFPQYPQKDASSYALKINSPAVKTLCQQCKKLGLYGILNFYLEENGHYFDASPIISAGGEILGISKMVHIPNAPCFYEQDYYTPSDTGFHVYDTTIGKIGIVICFDRHFPESIRNCVLSGAEIIIIPTVNTKGEPLELFEWEMRVAAMQNGVFIAMCNRVGTEDAMTFAGESLIVDPYGEVIFKADDLEQLIVVDVDLSKVSSARKIRPYLNLLRPSLYNWSMPSN